MEEESWLEWWHILRLGGGVVALLSWRVDRLLVVDVGYLCPLSVGFHFRVYSGGWMLMCVFNKVGVATTGGTYRYKRRGEWKPSSERRRNKGRKGAGYIHSAGTLLFFLLGGDARRWVDDGPLTLLDESIVLSFCRRNLQSRHLPSHGDLVFWVPG